MKYVFALLLPPVALLMVGKPFQALLNFLVCCTLVLIPVGIIWAVIGVSSAYEEGHERSVYRAARRLGRH